MTSKSRFTVDTHVFRELGTLLVGRVSTAVVELIKNAYDADAGEVRVHGHALEDKESSYILVSDNGKGMSLKEFNEGFLRIASRGKETAARRSRVRERKYTGAKGIGRLAARKLSELIEITSTSRDGSGRRQQVKARIDWKAVEKKPTLDDLGEEEVTVTSTHLPAEDSTEPGTEIKLRKLRQTWTPDELKRFLEEMQSLEPFELLTRSLSDTRWRHRILDEPLLFEEPRLRDSKGNDTFHVQLTGMFAKPGDYWDLLADSIEWVIEVEASAQDNVVRYCITPTRSFRLHHTMADKKLFEGPHPDPSLKLSFQARILVRKGNWTQVEKAREWIESKTGIRVFMEGFRVLPYGEKGNDWLSIDEAYAKRLKSQKLLGEELLTPEEQEFEKENPLGLGGSPNAMYLGAVFLTEAGAPSLKMLVNREGFERDPTLELLEKMLRTAIDLFRRRRAMAREDDGAKRKPAHRPRPQRGQPPAPRTTPAPSAPAPSAPARSGGPEPVSEAPMQLRLLEALGVQVPTFARDSRALVNQVRSMEANLTRLLKDRTLEKKARQGLTALQSSLGELSQGLERLATYQDGLTTPMASAKASRHSLLESTIQGLQLVQSLAERNTIAITYDIPATLKSPPMLPAELTCVSGCLLSHAVERAGTRGRILVTGYRSADGLVRLRVERTGKAVAPRERERALESVSLPREPELFILRELLAQHGAELRFTPPGAGYAAAVEVIFPK